MINDPLSSLRSVNEYLSFILTMITYMNWYLYEQLWLIMTA